MTRVVKPVPAPAKVLLNFISGPESNGIERADQGYEVWSSFKQRNLPKPLTKSTISEVLGYQRNWRSIGGISSAAGRYQIIRKTLEMLIKMLGLTGSELFDQAMQDRLGYQLLKIRGYDAWLAGNNGNNAFANSLAKEWASLPVVTSQANYKGVLISAGTSYYAGDGLNSHGVSVQSVKDALAAARSSGDADDAFVPVPTPKPALSKGKAAVAVVVGGGAVVAGDAASSGLTPDQLYAYYTTLKPVLDLAISYGPWGVGALMIGAGAYIAHKYGFFSRFG